MGNDCAVVFRARSHGLGCGGIGPFGGVASLGL